MSVNKQLRSRWDAETTLLFVRLYKQRECLWNHMYPDYTNKDAKEAAYKEIADILNIPDFDVNDIKNKIRTLRSTYAQELKKIRLSKIYQKKQYVPRLKWFKEMHEFLWKNTQGHRFEQKEESMEFENMFVTMPNDLDKPDYNDYDEDDDVTTLEVKDEPLSDGEFVEYDDVKMEEPDDLVIEEKYHTHSENTNHHHNDDNDVKVKLPIEICSVLPNGTSSSSSIKSEYSLSSSSPSSSNQIIIDNVSASMNEFVIFGKNVATQLRQMKLVNALEAQAQISALLTHYRLKQLKGTLLKSEGLPVLVLPQNKM